VSAELARVEQWMYSVLSGDPTISGIVGTRIYADEAPQEAAFPLVIFAHIGNIDILRGGAGSHVSKVIYLVRAVDKSSSIQGNLKTVADRFDPLLLVGNTTVGDVKLSTQHDQHHVRRDSEFGVPMVYLGSYYLVFTQPA
jgi:hypothetical protein